MNKGYQAYRVLREYLGLTVLVVRLVVREELDAQVLVVQKAHGALRAQPGLEDPGVVRE